MQASQSVGNCNEGVTSPEKLVRHIDSLEWHDRDDVRWATAFSRPEGTEALSLFVAEVASGETRPVVAGSSESVVFVLEGRGAVAIDDREFDIDALNGVHVRQGETFILRQSGREALRVLILICPSPDQPPWISTSDQASHVSTAFDHGFPERVVAARQADRESTGDRSFRILVGPKIGSMAVTQFVGSIPHSRAPEHYHLYEEVICVLSGHGKMWIGDNSMPVSPGSLIFLPREQAHCLECTSEAGLELVGMFYPAGSPAVNYSTDAS